MKVAIIPARGGSTRIPRKNIRPFHGKPIIAYAIQTAKNSGLFDGGVWVSTEDAEIAQVARNYGAGVIPRPPELAEIGAPDCGTHKVTAHALEWLQRGNLIIEDACCIYATAPMMTADDLIKGWEILNQGALQVYPVLGGTDAGQWYWARFHQFASVAPWHAAARLELPHQRVCDINVESDWVRAERMYADLHGLKVTA